MAWWHGKSLAPVAAMPTAQWRGQQGEAQALAYLQAEGLHLLERNYRTPGRGGGEIDLIMQAADGTVVFVEVRSRSHSRFGGAGGSIDVAKRQRIVQAAQHWLLRQGVPPACRFDVIAIDGIQLQWLRAAFDAA